MSRIEYREVYDGFMFVVYDSHGNRRGAFDSEWDAEAFLGVMDDGSTIEPTEPIHRWDADLTPLCGADSGLMSASWQGVTCDECNRIKDRLPVAGEQDQTVPTSGQRHSALVGPRYFGRSATLTHNRGER